MNENFDRNYTDYEYGFGDRNGEFWLGLQPMHHLTDVTCNELRIEMEKYDGSTYVAKYSTFKVGSEEEGYVLNLDGFSSNPTFIDDFGTGQGGRKFSARDKDQDAWSDSCAHKF